MLKSLHIERIAIIDDITLNFNQGLTALTGETGAGKSIIMESLQLIFGKRSDYQLIRDGFEEALVSATFQISKEVQLRFNLDEVITIERILSKTGKHQMKLNHKPVTLQTIKTITPFIGDIHEQDDLYQLLDPSQYVDMIDARDRNKIEPLLTNYLLAKSKYEDHIKAIQSLKEQHQSFLEKQDILSFQLEELKSLHLEKPVIDELSSEIDQLKHYDLIKQNLMQSMQILDETSLVETIYTVMSYLKKVSPYLKNTMEMDELETAYYSIKEIHHTIKVQLQNLDYDEFKFETLQNDLYHIQQMLKKYNMSETELIDYRKKLQQQCDMVSDYDTFIKEADFKLEHLKNEVLSYGKALHKARIEISHVMSKEIVDVLKILGLPDAKFEIDIQIQDHFEAHGLDEVFFNISLNQGESLKPLSKVASGGERARFMFALKATHARHHKVSMLVLDEIDSGVSGMIAAKVAQFMEYLSQFMQVIVITHLPQVAAKANTHIGVKKVLMGDRVLTQIESLENDHRVAHIAMMLSDDHISTFAIEQAKLLLHKNKT